MSHQRVEVIRRIYDDWGRGNFRTGAELFDPHVLLVLRPEFPDRGRHLGPEGIATYMRRDLLPAYTDFAIVGEEFIGVGDSVVVRVHQTGGGRSSGVMTELRYFQVWTFRGDRVIRIESVAERRDALAAVGLPEG